MIIQYYLDRQGREPFVKWLNSIRDTRTQARIYTKLERVALGNLGDHASVGDGVFELRLDFGPGYRIYYGKVGNKLIVLLAGGIKRSQVKDIKKAKQYWKECKSLQ